MIVIIVRNDDAEYEVLNAEAIKIISSNYEIKTHNQFEGHSLIYIPYRMVKKIIIEGEDDV